MIFLGFITFLRVETQAVFTCLNSIMETLD